MWVLISFFAVLRGGGGGGGSKKGIVDWWIGVGGLQISNRPQDESTLTGLRPFVTL